MFTVLATGASWDRLSRDSANVANPLLRRIGATLRCHGRDLITECPSITTRRNPEDYSLRPPNTKPRPPNTTLRLHNTPPKLPRPTSFLPWQPEAAQCNPEAAHHNPEAAADNPGATHDTPKAAQCNPEAAQYNPGLPNSSQAAHYHLEVVQCNPRAMLSGNDQSKRCQNRWRSDTSQSCKFE